MANLPTWAELVAQNEDLRPWTSDGWCLDHTGTEWEWWHDKTHAVLEEAEHEDVAIAFVERRAVEWLARQRIHIVLRDGLWRSIQINPEATTCTMTDIACDADFATALRQACATLTRADQPPGPDPDDIPDPQSGDCMSS